MGFLQDLLKDVPLSAVLRERVVLAEEKYQLASDEAAALRTKVNQLQSENADLRAQSKNLNHAVLSDATLRVLLALFSSRDEYGRSVHGLAEGQQIEESVLQYHLDRLQDHDLAEAAGWNIRSGAMYWALTAKGRQLVVEKGLA